MLNAMAIRAQNVSNRYTETTPCKNAPALKFPERLLIVIFDEKEKINIENVVPDDSPI